MNANLYKRILRMVLLCLLISACSSRTNEAPSPTPSQASGVTATQTFVPTSTPPPEPTPTTASDLVVMLAGTQAEASLISQTQPVLGELATIAGLRFQMWPSLSQQDLTPEIRLVVALPPDPGLVQLVASAPQTQFLAIGIPGLEPVPNLSMIGPQGARPDEIGFLAGYIAAAVTPEWRVGVMAIGDSTAGVATREGFLNGVVFF